jgi:Spy/CpxP family protein refolding chaperone
MLHPTPGDLMNLTPRALMPSLSRPAQMLIATLMVAAAGLAQPAHAQPMGPMHGGPGGPGGMHEGMHEGMHGGGTGMGMGMGMGGAHMGRVLDVVKATPEQRSQIKAIMDTARKDLKAQHGAGRTLHQQMQAAFAQPNIDAAAVETLRQQISAQHDAASKRMTLALLDASKVLTPEQRKTVADMMAKRQAMMQRHASERATLDKSTK